MFYHAASFLCVFQVPVNDMDEAGPMDIANGVQRSGSGAGRGGKGGRGQMRGMLACVCWLSCATARVSFSSNSVVREC